MPCFLRKTGPRGLLFRCTEKQTNNQFKAAIYRKCFLSYLTGGENDGRGMWIPAVIVVCHNFFSRYSEIQNECDNIMSHLLLLLCETQSVEWRLQAGSFMFPKLWRKTPLLTIPHDSFMVRDLPIMRVNLIRLRSNIQISSLPPLFHDLWPVTDNLPPLCGFYFRAHWPELMLSILFHDTMMTNDNSFYLLIFLLWSLHESLIAHSSDYSVHVPDWFDEVVSPGFPLSFPLEFKAFHLPVSHSLRHDRLVLNRY